MKNLSNQQLAYFLLRITLGFNFLGHGLVRFPKIDGFKTWMISEFQHSLIPTFVTSAFASALPFIEFSIGLLLLLGLFTRNTLVAAALLMISLIFGSCLIEKWEFVGFQMIYAVLIYVLIHNVHVNTIMLYKSQS